jgi:protein gp37
MSIPHPVPELWRKNSSGFAITGGRSTDSSNALMSKIAEHVTGLKTGSQLHFRFRSYGGKTFPEWPKLVEGAKIAQKLL